MEAIIGGQCDESEMALLLTSLSAKGETADEVAGAAAALRSHMERISSRRTGLLDTCGTGGDGSGTLNISTAAAIVAAAAGVPVAKHGNRGITSKSGSADVLSELGVNIEASVSQVEACLDVVGIGFCFAQLFHPAMRQVATVRKRLGIPTVFNLLGPLCNPAAAPFQLLGVGRPELRHLLAGALEMLGTQRALVVWGEDGLDEVTLSGATQVTQVGDGMRRDFRWTPSDFGLEAAPLDELRINSPAESAARIRDILAGKPGAARDIVILNAAAALYTAGKAAEPQQCAALAAEAIDSGGARQVLTDLAERSHR